MRCLNLVLLFTQWFYLTSTFPLSTQDFNTAKNALQTRNGAGTLTELTAEFRGIHWDTAYGDCTAEQLDKIIYSTRASMWMLEKPLADGDFLYSEAWNRYFGPYENWLKYGTDMRDRAVGIIRKYLGA